MALVSCRFCHDPFTVGLEEPESINRDRLRAFLPFSELQPDCRYCCLLRKMIVHFVPDIKQHYVRPHVWLLLEKGCAARVDVGDLGAEGGRGDYYVHMSQFYIYLQHNQPCQDLPLIGCLGRHSIRPDSEECFEFVQRQIQTCFELHEYCHRPSEPLLPRRILSLGRSDTDNIRLVEVNDQIGIYAALSHCWGNSQPIRTLTANIAQIKRHIPWESLSSVFRDAIQVCRRLGLAYIWIDTLCILQDNKEDWDLESSKMCQYYENAFITISATASPSSFVPFLKERAIKWRAQSFPFECSDGKSIDVFARRDSGKSDDDHKEDPGALGTRAWALQETLLSRRVLYFTESELVWECRSCILAEDDITPYGLCSARLPQLLLRCEEGVDAYNVWHSLVKAYVLRQLTFESDRLPALSGAAAKFQFFTESNYVAGLWVKNLPLDLCWSVNYLSDGAGSRPAFSSSNYLAPSWAWPSVTGSISFVDNSVEQPFVAFATVTHVECTCSGLNPYGQVDSGHLVLRARIARIQLTCADPTNFYAYILGCDEDSTDHMIPDSILVASNGRIRKAVETDELSSFSLEVSCILLGRDEDEEAGSSYFHILLIDQVDAHTYSRFGYTALDSDEYFVEKLEQTIFII